MPFNILSPDRARPALRSILRRARLGAVIMVTAVSAGCATTREAAVCAAGEEKMMFAQLFFGRNIGAVPAISEAQFGSFVDEVLSRRFPEGMTHLSGTGHWRGAGKAPVREQSEVVTLVLPDVPASYTNLEGARREYMARFGQESVLMTYQPVCTRV
ncbi:hypothetical protein GGC65_002407 [Sphingopyxis sp. OAS728]|uniref:DUF3574 domain-containing protein n=1 Tax=Sphingopyxis sp. OAS728 TaxID=2663823 RepID=UPI001789262B|nr:DUF3574 domain-containing protein [Sphingopyxis sp. OAS728]MBE1527951.1 hypothetical protein [Sphingopyxis sp. OAS728]